MCEKATATTTRKEIDFKEAKNILHYLCGDDETSTDDIIDRFSQISPKYDKILEAVSYDSPMQTAQTTAELFPGNREHIYILDAAAGTGLCAEKLFSYGFRKMDALEPSSKMLEEAKTKGLYRRYFINGLGENTLGIDDETYDAVTICAMSTVVMKKLPMKAFEELIRIIKPGGYIINTAFYCLFPEDGDDHARLYRANVKTLECHGRLKQVELRRFPQIGFDADGAVSVHKVLK
ncbi:methyltransferase-like protein 27 [Haliotis rufescens]|uniref:methyltransferase-like protein 27 n=1 Tax=Haliotis rufescens TaxID=6454 RepID=UPI001EB07516|nr:methyltransferase-like protein 27 [Haliotis rufescens]XP_048240557.1 methyltransferase-like protein 27 [Haliotis rufescens]XP_048240558.1 methyltransferase-like protein 27 [Haliotis rufescens]